MNIWLEVNDWWRDNFPSYRQIWCGGSWRYQNASYHPMSVRSLLCRNILGVAARLPGTLWRGFRHQMQRFHQLNIHSFRSDYAVGLLDWFHSVIIINNYSHEAEHLDSANFSQPH